MITKLISSEKANVSGGATGDSTPLLGGNRKVASYNGLLLVTNLVALGLTIWNTHKQYVCSCGEFHCSSQTTSWRSQCECPSVATNNTKFKKEE